jgi:hypothetical protein
MYQRAQFLQAEREQLAKQNAQLRQALVAMVSPYTHDGDVKVFTDLPPALRERLTLARAALGQVQA